MKNKSSPGISFWGYLFVALGVWYAFINSARNIWRLDYILVPILLVTIGLAVLNLKNWGRILCLILMFLFLITSGFTHP